MNQKLEVYYDIQADILEITIGKYTSCVFDEVADDVFSKLRSSALRFMSSERDLREALSHFPKD